ncbi:MULTISPECIES: glycosyltransferase [unclassified Yoonia]|uniref:glycosyltransferase n=1 Tax=unclassified Yoonia TaxID=2629118 RepID=UPI002AFF6FF1|nr:MULTISPECIES: glycosyltransferase [unclassified Yoonia]
MLDSHDDRAILPRFASSDAALLAGLLAEGAIAAPTANRAQASAQHLGLPLADILLRQFDLDAAVLARHQGQIFAATVVDPRIDVPTADLVARLDAAHCLRAGLLPWRAQGGRPVILTCRPDSFARHRHDLEQIFGPVDIGITTETELTGAIETLYGPAMKAQAENCVAAQHSCRGWTTSRARRIAASIAVLLTAAAIIAPQLLAMAVLLWAITMLAATTALKLASAVLALRGPPAQLPPVTEADLPVITMLVPLYRETAIAAHLLVRLAALRYPRALLDVCLVLEADDDTTRATLARTALPGWIRAITVPPGQVRTKPRALNYALPFARGSLIGVWDAEDAPAPDQLHVVARHFAAAAPDVACLQGVLDYYNTSTNWLTRCFTIEYAAWFRVVLPGLARLGVVVPLGGTTLFFRRTTLEELGAWDAHNVTEDADLGLRLARHGYRTALIPTVTLEEANSRGWPWVKQRARWLKGYAITYLVHMRNPLALLQDLGFWRFFGIQVIFAGALSLYLLIPLFWTLWLIPFGFTHPLQIWLPAAVLQAVGTFFVLSEIIALLVNLIGLRKAGRRDLWAWALTLPFYFPLGALAACRGLVELVIRPFYWDKTAHNVARPGPVIPPPRPPPRPVSAL